MPEPVGIANLPNQRLKIVSQQGATFTIMVCGESGLGKTTFINTLFESSLKPYVEPQSRHNKFSGAHQTVDIDIVRAILEEKNFKIRLNIIDTPGFGNNVNNHDSWTPIIDFIDDQHEAYMKQEQQPLRVEKKDLRVHACLYFIRPTGHSLKPLDIEIMKRLSTRVNLIPVISKSDTLSPKELAIFKSRIRDIIEAQDINIYTPPLELDDPAAAEHAKQLIESMPFAIIGSEDKYEVDGQLIKGRKYPWGIVEVENDQHCDFKKLRSLLLRTNMLDLILSTNEIHFESFRSIKLGGSSNGDEVNGEGEANGELKDKDEITNENGEIIKKPSNINKKPRRLHNPKFKEEEDALKKFFTEQVKAEEQRFRQWETNIVNERNRLNQDLEELQSKMKTLEDQVKKLQLTKRPESPPLAGGNQKYKRNYRACLNCRLRKVKCDLGPVDNPREGKCARCLRERKECVFVESKRGGSGNVSTGRKKRKVDEGEFSGSEGADTEPEVHVQVPVQPKPIPRLPPVGDMLSQTVRPPPVPLSDVRQTQKHHHHHHQNHQNQHQQNHQNHHQQQPQNPPPQDDFPSNANKSNNDHFSTMEGALVFLANAAGTIAKADERDNIDARVKHAQLEASAHSRGSSDDVTGVATPDDKSGVSPVAHVSSGTHTNSGLQSTEFSSSAPQTTTSSQSSVPQYIRPNLSQRMTMPAAENAYIVRPRGSNKLSNIEYIGGDNGILTEDEAERLIQLFFSTMHPFFPHLPTFLHSSKVLSGYPILLCAILTISSRYHPFENNAGTTAGGVPRNIEVHDRLWLYVQRLISQTVWAEASTRSIGTVFAFLLFTEWNPRAIHWRWSDYANKADDGNDELGGLSNNSNNGNGGNGGNSNVSNNTNNNNKSGDVSNLAGLGAMRRSYRMAWMLIGSAVRLAQDMGFMEISSRTFLATHIAEINSVMNISRRSMLGHSLSEVDLDEDDISEEALAKSEDMEDRILNLNEEELKRLSTDSTLRFTLSQKAQVELLQIISIGHESLYGYRAQLGSLTQRQNLSVLNLISPLINNWGRKYNHYLVPSSHKLLRNVSNLQAHWLNPQSKISREIADSIERESFLFEFNYVKLYIYSLALSPSPRSLNEQKRNRKGKVTLKLDEISKSAKYIEQAFKSANEMLSSAHRVHRLKMLRFMPVRWLTRMVRAVAFIVKCYLTITAHKNGTKNMTLADTFDATILSLSLISVDEIIHSIQRAAITLRDCSPDELHLCTRYSTVLMYLCSEMKTKAKNLQEVNIEYDPMGREAGAEVEAEDAEDAEEEEEQSESETETDTHPERQVESVSQPMSQPMSQPFVVPVPPHTQPQPQPQPHTQPYPATNMYQSSSQSQTQTQTQPQATVPQFSYSVSNESITPSNTNTGNASPVPGLTGEWFMNDKNIGLDFVVPWMELIEQQLPTADFNFDEQMLR
ncbi:Septin-domain-containing protein [Scheffersomyces amazonensis]|uniref:Septin-domain-containing protein n=1 Tax=Scheffersomyces amazonensis TaxID=1078765 RepID=UPI00315D06F5